MQYKIPVQIENEDPIFLGFSLRQLAIVIVGGGIGYNIFKVLADSLGPEIAAIPGIIIFVISVMIAKFKVAGMTFMQFILSFIRYKINYSQRKWMKGIDSYQAIDIGYILNDDKNNKGKINLDSKKTKLKTLEEKINKL